MENTYFENNKVEIVGEVCQKPVFSHVIYGEKFYLFRVRIPRLSENYDTINVTISERFFPEIVPDLGDLLHIEGQFRSYNNFSDTGNRLILTVFAKSVERVYEPMEYQNPNQIFLCGYICKPPVYRMTPLGREIADLLMAVNRPYGKSDYLPCICWGRNARFAGKFEVGTHIHLWGRIQSRTYQKRLDNDVVEKRTAYEISVSKIECVE